MPVPTDISNLSTTTASNYPSGSDVIGNNLDNYLRVIQSIIKQMVSKGTNVASATSITLPNDGQVFNITGTSNIATVANSWDGRIVVFQFDSTASVVSGGNITMPPGITQIKFASGDFCALINKSTGWTYLYDSMQSPSLALVNTTFNAVPKGVIYKSGTRFIHDFNYGNNGTVTTNGYNTFVGYNAGNFSTGATATSVGQSSENTGIGYSSLNAVAKGFGNSCLGSYSAYSLTDGQSNTAIGSSALYNLTTGSGIIAVGYGAGSTAVTNTSCIFIGGGSQPLSDSTSYEIVIGGSTGYGSGTTKIGTSYTQQTLIPAGVFGYGTGAGGQVTQTTSRTTGVTLDKGTGSITLVSAAGSTSWQSFTVSNVLVKEYDTIEVSQKSGTDKYMIHVTKVQNGSFDITYATTGGTTTEQPVFNFCVYRGAAA